MLYVYTPESVGGVIIHETRTGKYHSQDLFLGNHLVHVSESENGDMEIVVFENTKTIKVISNVELEVQKHKTDNFFAVRRKSEDS